MVVPLRRGSASCRILVTSLAVILMAGIALGGCNKMRKEAIAMVNEGVRSLNRGDEKTARSHFLRATRHDP